MSGNSIDKSEEYLPPANENSIDKWSRFLQLLAEAPVPGLSAALTRWRTGESSGVGVQTDRGRAMLSVAEDNLSRFEHDNELKSYSDHNHAFADLLVPLSGDVTAPIIFWLSRSNDPGVSISRISSPAAFVISLGKPYSYADVTAALSYALGKQGVRAKGDWFAKTLEEHGLNPHDPAFSSLVKWPDSV